MFFGRIFFSKKSFKNVDKLFMGGNFGNFEKHFFEKTFPKETFFFKKRKIFFFSKNQSSCLSSKTFFFSPRTFFVKNLVSTKLVVFKNEHFQFFPEMNIGVRTSLPCSLIYEKKMLFSNYLLQKC